LHHALAAAGLPGIKINPWRARRFAEATGRRVKTDSVDAAMLARFGARLQPDIPPARDTAIDALAELQAARRALIKARTAALNWGQNLTLALLKRQNQQQPKQIEAQIEAMSASRPRSWRNRNASRHASTSCSTYQVSALALLIDMPELGSIAARQAASLSGPITRQSGCWRGKSVIQGGSAPLRQAGKPAKVAIVAVMRKLVVLVNALLRDNRSWSEARPGA
jgi:transposase